MRTGTFTVASVLIATHLGVLPDPARAQSGTRLRDAEILEKLASRDHVEWEEGAWALVMMPDTARGPLLREALIDALEQQVLWEKEWAEGTLLRPDGEYALPEFLVGEVLKLRNPESIEALAWYVGRSPPAQFFLGEFGLRSVGPLLDVAESPGAGTTTVSTALGMLADIVEYQGGVAASDWARMKGAVELHLIAGPPDRYRSAWKRAPFGIYGAMKLAGVLREPAMLDRLADLAQMSHGQLDALGLLANVPLCARMRLEGRRPPVLNDLPPGPLPPEFNCTAGRLVY